MLARSEASDRLGVSRKVLDELAAQSRLIVLSSQTGDPFYPAWQFDVPERHRRALGDAHARLVNAGDLSPWTAASWFSSPHPELDGLTPVAYLRAGGDPARVLDAAEHDAARAGQ